MNTLNINKLSEIAIALLDGYHLYNTIPEAVESALYAYLHANTFTYNEQEISPLEMMDAVWEILNAYNEQVEK